MIDPGGKPDGLLVFGGPKGCKVCVVVDGFAGPVKDGGTEEESASSEGN